MQVVSISDLDTREALHAATRIRRSTGWASVEPQELQSVVSLVGGRLSYLNKVCFIAPSLLDETRPKLYTYYMKISKSRDMTSMGNHLLQVEKAWLLSQIGTYYLPHKRVWFIQQYSVPGLIPDCDDDVMDEVCCFMVVQEDANA